MTRRSTGQLELELRRLIDYSMTENRLTWAEIIGTLEIIKMDLFLERPIEWTEEDEHSE